MPFVQCQGFTKARIDKPMSLGHANIDPAAVTLTFVYQELTQENGIWLVQEKKQLLQRDVHYKLDRRRGVIMLIDHPFWQQERRWRAADRVEPLLYKGQVKHPQRIDFDYEHYAPKEVEASEVADEVDQEARERLGYDLPKHTLAAEPSVEAMPFNWEDKSNKAVK